jgi:hypothetical protein
MVAFEHVFEHTGHTKVYACGASAVTCMIEPQNPQLLPLQVVASETTPATGQLVLVATVTLGLLCLYLARRRIIRALITLFLLSAAVLVLLLVGIAVGLQLNDTVAAPVQSCQVPEPDPQFVSRTGLRFHGPAMPVDSHVSRPDPS